MPRVTIRLVGPGASDHHRYRRPAGSTGLSFRAKNGGDHAESLVPLDVMADSEGSAPYRPVEWSDVARPSSTAPSGPGHPATFTVEADVRRRGLDCRRGRAVRV